MPLTRRRALESPTATRSADTSIPLNDQNDHPDDRPAKRRRVDPSLSQDVSRQGKRVESGNSTRAEANKDDSATPSTTRPKRQEALKKQSPRATSRVKLDNLSILDNLSTQILSTLSKSTAQEMRLLLGNPTGPGADFATVRSLFDNVKQVYLSSSPFLSSHSLELVEIPQIETLRKANFATFFTSIFTGEIALQELDANFLDLFVPENGRLLKAQSSILLDLKTQAFIVSTQQDSDTAPEDSLRKIFPTGVEARLLAKRPGSKMLVPSENDFIKRSTSRRDILAAEIKKNSLTTLVDRYRWDDFLREVSSYLNKNFELMCPGLDRDTLQAGRLVPANVTNLHSRGDMEGLFSYLPPSPTLPKKKQPAIQKLPTPPPPPPAKPAASVAPPEPPQEDFVAKAARAARMALEGNGRDFSFGNPYRTPPPQPPPPPPPPPQTFIPQPAQQTQPTFQHYQPPTPNPQKPSLQGSSPSTDLPHISQTAPTQVLYERARQAATAKPPKPNKSSTPSQRRPWTTEEENALMAGLDRVRGPHWAQILGMFGPGGTINESLKDRNQVQLKDKARNLKLFFLKSGIEVPYYLREVTGDLRTRAPAQASRQQAREVERRQGLEDKAHFAGVQGIMALAGGGQGVATDDQPTPPLPELAAEEEEDEVEADETSS